jgi:hydroxymethylbilane synthase
MPDRPLLVRIATRASPLALAQAEEAAARLTEAGAGALTCKLVAMTTIGDQITDRRLIEAGGKGLFTRELDQALSERRAEIAAHSLKDVPAVLPDDQVLAAFLPREDPREAFLSPGAGSLMELPKGALLGTASLRRQAQALRMRPDLQILALRGNVQTRLRKLEAGEAHATFLAAAGLARLGLSHLPACFVNLDEMMPAAGQGIVAIAALRDCDPVLAAALAAVDDFPARLAASAERAFLARLDGSCRTAMAAHFQLAGPGAVMTGEVLSPDGVDRYFAKAAVGHAPTPEQAHDLGVAIAEEIAAAAGDNLPRFAPDASW